MAKYIKCDCCGKRIPFGADIYRIRGNAPLYCSADCFADTNAYIEELNDELAYDCWRKVYNDEEEAAIRQEILRVKADITSLEEKLKDLEFDLKAYENS